MAVRFDAATDAYTTSIGVGAPTGSTYTASCWIYLTTDRNAFSGPWGLATNVSNYIQADTDTDGTTLKIWSATASFTVRALTLATWYYLAVVVNGTANCTSYISEGTAEALVTASSVAMGAPNAPQRLSIGDGFPGNGEWWNGRVAAFKLWDAALTQAEIEAERVSVGPVRGSSLLRYHPFVVADTLDYSGNGNTLTAGGTATATEAGPPIPRGATPIFRSSARPRAANF